MKKMVFLLAFLLATTPALGTEPGAAQVLTVSKDNYSKNMFLVLECLSNKGLTDQPQSGDLALEHCKDEANATLQIGLVYNNMPSQIVIDLDRYQSATRDLIVCLSGVRGTKASENEPQQSSQDATAIKDCGSLPNSVGDSANSDRFIQTL